MAVRPMSWGKSDWLFAVLLSVNVLCAIGWAWLWRKLRVQPEKSNLSARILTTTSLSIVAALGTLPSNPPFQPSHALGIGLLSGALGASLSFWLWEIKGKFWLSYIGTISPFAIALFAHAANPFPSLFGLLVANGLAWFCLGEIWRSRALVAVSLVAAIGLARLHEMPAGLNKQIWQSLPIFLSLAGWIGVGLLESWQRYWQRTVKGVGNFFVLSASLLLGSAIVSYWVNDWRFFAVTLLACFAALIAVETENADLRELTVLIWIGLLVLSFAVLPAAERFRLLGGFGSALTSVTLVWLAVAQNTDHHTLWQGTTLTTTFALFRLFAEIHSLPTPRADLYTHYTFVGFLLGATVPVILMRWMEQKRYFVRDLEVGFWSAVVPVILGAVWGVKAVAGYLAGGIASVLLVPPFNSPTLFAGFATALPLTALVEPASDLPRKIRIWILVGAAIAFAITLLVDTFVERLGTRKR